MTNQTRQSTRVLLLAALLVATAGCAVYRAEVRQGNFIDAAKLEMVKPGMSREQVEFLLGPPMVVDGFQRDRWDYVFMLESPLLGGETTSRRFAVLFDGEVVRELKHFD